MAEDGLLGAVGRDVLNRVKNEQFVGGKWFKSKPLGDLDVSCWKVEENLLNFHGDWLGWGKGGLLL